MGLIEPLVVGNFLVASGIPLGSSAALVGMLTMLVATLAAVLLARDVTVPRSA